MGIFDYVEIYSRTIRQNYLDGGYFTLPINFSSYQLMNVFL
ncbi:Uncharacterised protein [Leclercia adecarboxylata]|uniref:Uncharacterized protein n=1 Tax=Leclercia adecarboxylata TaxID=83655 RepID=A0A4U9HZT5_9ENTR|nr:Uncharacterised protein [Leclercia adecarboxylata]STY91575.1 Uncharacterised protein [Leclercia adecarboxylata]VTP69495.1 Uncharacterised protein [Leclercia adecarboxylata]